MQQKPSRNIKDVTHRLYQQSYGHDKLYAVLAFNRPSHMSGGQVAASDMFMTFNLMRHSLESHSDRRIETQMRGYTDEEAYINRRHKEALERLVGAREGERNTIPVQSLTPVHEGRCKNRMLKPRIIVLHDCGTQYVVSKCRFSSTHADQYNSTAKLSSGGKKEVAVNDSTTKHTLMAVLMHGNLL
jgi:hypothetical protein